jgi:PAS domain S-box-containing protein
MGFKTATQVSDSKSDFPGIGTYEWRPDQDQLIWSDELVRIYGLTEPPSSEDGFLSCVHPEDRVRVEAETSGYLTDADGYSHEFRIVRPNGEIRYVHDRGIIERDSFGRIVRLAGINFDITDQISHREHQLERQRATPRETELALFVQHAPAAVAMFDCQMRYVAASQRYLKEFRLPEIGEIVGRSHYDVLPEIPERWRETHRRVLTGETLSADDDPLRRRDGSTDYVRWSMSPWYDTDGSVAGAFMIANVVTATAEARKKQVTNYRRARRAIAVAGVGVGEVTYADGCVRLDPEARRLFGFGEDHDVVSREDIHARFHPEDKSKLETSIAAALDPDGNGWFEMEHRILLDDGTVHWVRARKQVVFKETPDGRVPSRAILTVLDMTEQKRISEALRASERMAAHILEHSPDCHVILDGNDGIEFLNEAARRQMLEAGHTPTLGAAWTDLWPDDVRQRIVEALAEARRGKPPSLELSCGNDGPSQRWMDVSLSGIWVAAPEVSKVLIVCRDITDQKRQLAAVESAQTAFRQLVERAPFGIYTVDADLRIVQISDGTKQALHDLGPLVGQHLGEVMGAIWPAEVADEIVARFRHTLETGLPYVAPKLIEERQDTGEVQAYDWQIERTTLSDGRFGVVCYFYDQSDRQRDEDHIQLLMNEANHRFKNILTLVQTIARRTAAGNPKDFVASLQNRIQALSSAQDLLINRSWKGTELSDLVRSQLAHFEDLVDDRITVAGPPVELKPQAAQTVGMALHELCTNAAKYGALSDENGRVEVTWAIEAEQPEASASERLRMSWTERDGPAVSPPTRTGFGEMVVKTIVASSLDGTVDLTYEPTGVAWTLTCPLSAVTSDGGLAGLGTSGSPETQAIFEGPTSVLIVEDEILIAMDVKHLLEDAGYEVIGPVSSVKQAFEALEERECSFAILDINLGKETSEPIAERCVEDNIPFVVVSSYRKAHQPLVFQSAPFISKPVQHAQLLSTVASVVGSKSKIVRPEGC